MFVVRACLQYELIEALFLLVFAPVPIWKLSPTLLEGEGEGGGGLAQVVGTFKCHSSKVQC